MTHEYCREKPLSGMISEKPHEDNDLYSEYSFLRFFASFRS